MTTKELAQLQFLQLVAVWIKIPGINGWRTPELKKITGFTVLGIRRCSLSAFSTLLFCVAEESLPSVSSFQTFHLLTIEAAAFFLLSAPQVLLQTVCSGCLLTCYGRFPGRKVDQRQQSRESEDLKKSFGENIRTFRIFSYAAHELTHTLEAYFKSE